jgi:hypothetical protein
MTAIIAVQIACDRAGCFNAHTPSLSAVASIATARREAHREGWVSDCARGNERRDYCPDHADGEVS